jgi:hypothetical protein
VVDDPPDPAPATSAAPTEPAGPRSLVGLSETADAPAPAAIAGHPFAIDDDRRYREVTVVGAGGLGTVLLARDQRLDRDVALKRIAARDGDPEAGARFLREARITARLDHPGIVPIHDAGRTADGRLFYTMRLIRGRELLGPDHAAAAPEARLGGLGAYIAACHAVGYAHRHGIVHRDLKPANIMIGEFGEAQVVDWGLAEALDEPIAADAPAVGTLPYLAPEAAAGGRGTIAADVWALGAIGYELVTGSRRRPGERLEVLAALADGALPAATWPAEAPAELRAILERALAIDPAARYPDAEALALDLEAFRDGRRVAAYRYSPWQLARRFVIAWRWPLALVGAALVTGGAALAVTAHRTERQRVRAVAAERATRAELSRAEAALARALAARAVAAFAAGRHAEAELAAALALGHGEDPDARGVIAAIAASPYASVVERLALPGCPWVIPGADGDALCLQADAVERWTTAPLARAWRVGGRFDGAVATRTVVAAWDALGLTTIDRTTGAVQRFADPTRRAAVELDRPHHAVTDIDRDYLALESGGQVQVVYDTEAFAIVTAPCGRAAVDALAVAKTAVWVACSDGHLRVAAVDGPTSDLGPIGLGPSDGRVTSLALDEAGVELALGTTTGAIVRRDLRGCFAPGCAPRPERRVPPRGDGGVRALHQLGPITAVVSDGGDAVVLDDDPLWPRFRVPVAPGAELVAEEGGLVVGGAARWRFGGEVRGGPAGFSGPPRPTALAVAADGALAIGGDRALRVWSVDGAVVELPVGGRVASVAWSRDGRRLAVALLDDPDVGVRWFERDGAALRERPLPGAPGSARHVEFTADGALRALSSGELVVWEVAGPPARHDAPVAEVVSADGAWLCDGAGRRWQRRDRSWTAVGRCVDALGVAADARGARLAVAGRRAVALEEVATGAVTPIALAVEVTAVALAPDGGYLAVGTATGAVEVRRVADAAVVARLHGHRHPITGVWFTADAVITAGADGVVRRHLLAPLAAAPADLAAAAAARWRPSPDPP